MKSGKPLTSVTPKYVKEFRCIGAECESSCCTDWTISLDKDTTRRYRKSKDPVIAKIAADSIKITRSGHSEAYFAKIVLNQQKRCPFLAEDHLCEVQKRLGESALSETCNNYPRSSYRLGDQIRHSLSLSCPEAARKILLDPAAMWMEQSEYQEETLYSQTAEHLTALNAACLELVVLEQHSPEQKLYAIGVLLMQTQRLLDARASNSALISHIERSVSQIKQTLENGKLAQGLSELPFYAPPQISVLMQGTELCALGIQRAADRWQRSTADFIELATEHTERPHALLQQLAQGWQQAQAFFDQHPHILINYFIYQMFNENFPSSRTGENYLHQYRLLIVDFFLLRQYLAAQALQGPLTTDAVITLIQAQAVARQHNASFVKTISTMMDDLGLVGCYAISLLCEPDPDATDEEMPSTPLPQAAQAANA